MPGQGLPHAKQCISGLPMAVSEHQTREASCYFLIVSHPPDSEGRVQNLLPVEEERRECVVDDSEAGLSRLWKMALSLALQKAWPGKILGAEHFLETRNPMCVIHSHFFILPKHLCNG